VAVKVIPLDLYLPDGVAQLVPGSFEAGAPRYARGGVVLDVDVVIPPDLAASGWIWHGSFLRKAGPVGVAICTKTFGLPGVFENARELDRLEAEHENAPKKQVKVRGHKRPITLPDMPIEAIPEPELAYEQGVFGL